MSLLFWKKRNRKKIPVNANKTILRNDAYDVSGGIIKPPYVDLIKAPDGKKWQYVKNDIWIIVKNDKEDN